MERFILKKLNKVEGKEQYRVEVSNRFAALEDFYAEMNINSVCKSIRDNIRISVKENLGYYGLKKNKPWFDEGWSELLDQKKAENTAVGICYADHVAPSIRRSWH
jgi:hypothetical protein